VGVQFGVDGANLGAEVPVPPYVTAWDSRTVSNGAHVVWAIARDLAGNRAADTVSVTVRNEIPPPPADHLALAYAFDEIGGTTTADASGNGNTGFLHGATFENGMNGNAMAFDGTSDYVETPNSSSLDIGGTGLTIAFWAYIDVTSSGVDYVIVGKPWYPSAMVSPYYQYGVEYSNGWNHTLDFYFGDPSANLHGPYRMSPTTGAWTHVAYTYDGSRIRGYLDGVERLSTPDASSLQPRGNSLRLGVDGAYQQFYNGRVDDLRIYSRALSPTEIQSVMQTPVGGGSGDVPLGGIGLPRGITLLAGNPSPLTSNQWIAYTLPAAGEVDLAIFDVAGRRVRTLATGVRLAGPHRVEWDGADAMGRAVASGSYFLRLRADGSVKTVPVVRLR
jgi:hypothetical protein